jgi:hypothetical protein
VSFFEPLPPPPFPSERKWSPPAWDRPSEGTLPSTLAVDALLDHSEDAVWTIPTLDVFPNGFRVNVALLLNPHRREEIQQVIRRGPMGMIRIGVRFSDGHTGGRSSGHRPGAIRKDENGFPTEPIVGFSGGGGGGTGGWRFSAWVFPLPPDGPLEVFVAPPSPAPPAEFRAILDGSAVRAAADRAQVIWS